MEDEIGKSRSCKRTFRTWLPKWRKSQTCVPLIAHSYVYVLNIGRPSASSTGSSWQRSRQALGYLSSRSIQLSKPQWSSYRRQRTTITPKCAVEIGTPSDFLPGKAPCQDRGDSVITAENIDDLIGAFLTFQIGQINRDTLFEFHNYVYGEDPVLGEDVS
jgi:hypothetical protein